MCGLIVPWNFPMVIATWKLAPALAAGNPVVVKPASLTPLSALALGRLLVEAGVPPEAVSIVPGPGASVGDALVGDPRVHKVSFTGDSATGAGILRRVADNMTRVSLELGGKSASIVFDDADLERVIDAVPYSVFENAGQDCCARSRLLVQRGIYDQVVAGVAERTGRLRVGDPTDTATEVGPLISESQHAPPAWSTSTSHTTKGPRWSVAALRAAPDGSSTRRSSPTSTTRCASPGRRSSGRC